MGEGVAWHGLDIKWQPWTDMWQDTWEGKWKMAYTVITSLAQFLLPFAVVIAIYLSIFLKLRKRPKVGRALILMYQIYACYMF